MQKTDAQRAREAALQRQINNAGFTRITTGRVISVNYMVTPATLIVRVDGVDRQCRRINTQSPAVGETVAVAMTSGTSLVLGTIS